MRGAPLTFVLLAAMLCGALFGLVAPAAGASLSVLTNIFLRLIRSVIAPVLFGVLVRAMAEAGSNRANIGRIGWRSIVYFEVVSSLALITGWLACLLFRPGVGISLRHASASAAPVAPVSFTEVIVQMFPTSILDAMGRGDVLQITLFCLLFGLACAGAGESARPVVRFADTIATVAFRYTSYVMYLAPLAVFAAMAGTVAANGSSNALTGLLRFVLVAWAAQVVFACAVQAASVWASNVPLPKFIAEVREPFLVAFATTSSAAALPQTLSALRRLGLPEAVLGIVAPLSLSFNLCGSCIHLAMSAFFTAQAAGIDLSLGQQLLILATLKLTSKGVAGIPRANFVVLTGLFSTFDLPVEGLAVLLGIDALIDPVRTGVNVLGHCAAPPFVARWVGLNADLGEALEPARPIPAA